MNDSRGCGSCRHRSGVGSNADPMLCDVWKDDLNPAQFCSQEEIDFGCEHWRPVLVPARGGCRSPRQIVAEQEESCPG